MSDALRVGMLGCGRVAEHHVRFATAMPGVTVVGVADVNRSQAERLAARFGVKRAVASLEELLSERPDVVHVLTPPAFHYDQALAAIEAGAHVLIEKPATLRHEDTVALLERARERGVTVCPDFIQLFHPAMRRVTEMVDRGDLGQVVHVQCRYSLDLDDPELKEAWPLHWSYRLPGGLLHNYITHPLYLVLPWAGAVKRVFTVPRVHGLLPQGLTDHLETLIEGERGTASMVVTLAARPRAFEVRVQGTQGMVTVDFRANTLVVQREGFLPQSVARAWASFSQARQLAAGGTRNVLDFARGRLVPYQGLQLLLQAYYGTVREHHAPPVSPELTLAVSAAEAAVVRDAGRVHLDGSPRGSRQQGVTQRSRVLVTGAGGYVGREIVRVLADAGYYVRAFVRPASRVDELEARGIELRFGDVRDYEAVASAMEGVDVVVHAAAQLRGTPGVMLDVAVRGTENVARAAKDRGVSQVIYLSSLAVYDYLGMRRKTALTEKSPLEPQPEERGAATLAKRRAEDVALAQLANGGPAWTVLRPSLIFGKGSSVYAPVGLRLGKWLICFGGPRKELRLVHVEDVAEAVRRTVASPEARGGVFVVSHTDHLTFGEYVRRRVRPRAAVRVMYIPHWILGPLAGVLRVLHRVVRRAPRISRRRVAYLYRDLTADPSTFRAAVAWEPGAALATQLEREP